MIYTRNLVLLTALGTCFGIMGEEFINKKGSEFNNPWVNKVIDKFDKIPSKVDKKDYLGALTDGKIQFPRFTATKGNKWKIGGLMIEGGQNHFQAIIRLPQYLGLGKYIALTGSDPHDDTEPKTYGSYLFIIKMDSQPAQGKWTGNLDKKDMPNGEDKFVASIKISESLWHPGGIDICGKYLAITVTKGGQNQIMFFDITKPENPKKVTEVYVQGDIMAVALTRLENGHYLLADFYSDRNFYFRISNTTKMEDGFGSPTIVKKDDVKGKKPQNYQNINFVTDTTGSLFLVATANMSAAAPVLNLEDIADLLSVNVTLKTQKAPDSLKIENVAVEHIKRKHMYCYDKQCNFNAAGTIYLPDSDHIWLYGVYHWLTDDGKAVKFNQYAY